MHGAQIESITGKFTQSSELFRHAIAALKHPYELGYIREAKAALEDVHDLKRLACKFDVSAANRSLVDTYIVCVYFTGPAYIRIAPRRFPSFFVDWPTDVKCSTQVHVLENFVALRRSHHLISFQEAPSDEVILKVVNHLRSVLELSSNSQTIATEPIQVREDDPVFRADGLCHLRFIDCTLGSAVRLAIHWASLADATLSMAVQLSEPKRAPITVVIWTRQSAEVGKLDKISVPRQIWSILVNPAPPLATLQRDDELIVVIERCSASKPHRG